jgi:hypothetical protein
MIDSKFIIRYTNGLYDTHPDNSPSYQEFRDMFSSGQIYSKEWAITELKKLDIVSHHSVIIVGAWFGTLGAMMKQELPNIRLTMLDIDPRCETFIKNIGEFALTEDMYSHTYTEDVVVNTACEHIPNVRWWLDKLYPKTLVLLQSNNFFDGEDHVNCVSSKEEFEKQASLKEVLYSGELVTPMYTRYMIIGRV